MTQQEILKVQAYLREKFGTDRIRLQPGQQPADSVEVYLGQEFIGVVFRDDEEEDISYDFHMAILEMDLPHDGGM